MTAELEQARQWLGRAAEDLRVAEHGLTARPPLAGDVCFHAQQLAEKSLKAYLTWQGAEFEWTHRIAYLIDMCAQHDADLARLHDSADALTLYAVRFRYPYSGPAPTVEEALAGLEVARRVWRLVLDRLPPEAHPTD